MEPTTNGFGEYKKLILDTMERLERNMVVMADAFDKKTTEASMASMAAIESLRKDVLEFKNEMKDYNSRIELRVSECEKDIVEQKTNNKWMAGIFGVVAPILISAIGAFITLKVSSCG